MYQIDPGFLFIIGLFYYFSPSYLAIVYGVFNRSFFLQNLILGFTPIPRIVLILRAIKNKNLILNDKKELQIKLTKEEIEKIRTYQL